jgi:hypothetical protein
MREAASALVQDLPRLPPLGGRVMMGRQKVDQSRLFYLFNLESRIPTRTFCAASIRK